MLPDHFMLPDRHRQVAKRGDADATVVDRDVCPRDGVNRQRSVRQDDRDGDRPAGGHRTGSVARKFSRALTISRSWRPGVSRSRPEAVGSISRSPSTASTAIGAVSPDPPHRGHRDRAVNCGNGRSSVGNSDQPGDRAADITPRTAGGAVRHARGVDDLRGRRVGAGAAGEGDVLTKHRAANR